MPGTESECRLQSTNKQTNRQKLSVSNEVEFLTGTMLIFANNFLGKILTKTSILMQNCIEDDMVRKLFAKYLGIQLKI